MEDMPMRFVMLTVALALTVLPAQAQRVDLSTLTCQEFVDSKKETIGLLLMWLHGYLNDDDSPPIIDFDKIMRDGEKLGAYCATNPKHGLMTAAEQVLD
jgi:acid stress chaperone HdeB